MAAAAVRSTQRARRHDVGQEGETLNGDDGAHVAAVDHAVEPCGGQDEPCCGSGGGVDGELGARRHRMLTGAYYRKSITEGSLFFLISNFV
jgi:hypothetical protein